MANDNKRSGTTCQRCGRTYEKQKGFFYPSHAALYRGAGFIPYCRYCVDAMYTSYLQECGNAWDAVRQICRKLDIVWNEIDYKHVEKKVSPRSIIGAYLSRVDSLDNAGKSYDDTLIAEGTMWQWGCAPQSKEAEIPQTEREVNTDHDVDDDTMDIPDDIIAFWGSGYTPSMYRELEQRRSYWMSRYAPDEELDIGTEALIRQICSLELDINRDRAAGRSVEKSVIALNTLLGSANLKPVQKKQDDADAMLQNTPLGVWLYRFENERPLPDIDDELKENKYRRYVFTWMGHLCKMLGLKNAYSKLYEDEIERLRVEKPEYSGDDDEAFLMNVMEDAGDDELPFSDPPEDDES